MIFDTQQRPRPPVTFVADRSQGSHQNESILCSNSSAVTEKIILSDQVEIVPDHRCILTSVIAEQTRNVPLLFQMSNCLKEAVFTCLKEAVFTQVRLVALIIMFGTVSPMRLQHRKLKPTG